MQRWPEWPFKYRNEPYTVFRLAKIIKPAKPEPKSHAAAGMGTADILVVALAVAPLVLKLNVVRSV